MTASDPQRQSCLAHACTMSTSRRPQLDSYAIRGGVGKHGYASVVPDFYRLVTPVSPHVSYRPDACTSSTRSNLVLDARASHCSALAFAHVSAGPRPGTANQRSIAALRPSKAFAKLCRSAWQRRCPISSPRHKQPQAKAFQSSPAE